MTMMMMHFIILRSQHVPTMLSMEHDTNSTNKFDKTFAILKAAQALIKLSFYGRPIRNVLPKLRPASMKPWPRWRHR